MIAAQVTAREIRQRLMNPANGRVSSELDVCPEWAFRRRQAAQFMEARKAQQDFERQQAVEAALREALAERARAKEIAAKLLEEDPQPVTMTKILRTVSTYYGFSTIEICSARRSKQIAMPRHIVMYLGRHLTSCSLPQIGMKVGRRDHTTCMYAVEKITNMIEAGDIRLSADIDNIKWELGIR